MSTQPDRRDTPTVVVARTLRPGREAAYDRWLSRVEAVAARAPGFVGLESPPPTPESPDERVVVYRFATPELLGDWLTSQARRRVMDRGQALFVGEPVEQVVALPRVTEPVTAVASFDVLPGRRAAFQDAHAALVTVLTGFPGFLRSELLEPVDGVQDQTVVLFSFASRPDLDRWIASPERQEELAHIRPLLQHPHTLNVVGGFAGWFSAADAAPVRRWKQALVVLAALFPTALTLGLLRQAVLPDLGVVPATFLGNAAGVAILTWLLMPWLTRLLDGWLRR